MSTTALEILDKALYEIEQLVEPELSKPAFSGTREDMLRILAEVELLARNARKRIGELGK